VQPPQPIADCVGRALRFLQAATHHHQSADGMDYLVRNQNADGTWDEE